MHEGADPTLRADIAEEPSVEDVDLEIPEVYRYHSEGYDDYGWGCVYRGTQTVLRALGRRVPSLPELTCAMGTGDEWLRNPTAGCGWVEPHDVAEYFGRFVAECGHLRLVSVATRDGANLLDVRTCKVGVPHTYELLPRQPGLELGSPDAVQAAQRVRSLVVGHMARTRTPVLVDDSINAYVIAGFRMGGACGPEYRVLDPHYGMKYAARGEGRRFNPADGPNQYGPDTEKDQWVSAEWLEEGSGKLNGYRPGPMWLVLLIGA